MTSAEYVPGSDPNWDKIKALFFTPYVTDLKKYADEAYIAHLVRSGQQAIAMQNIQERKGILETVTEEASQYIQGVLGWRSLSDYTVAALRRLRERNGGFRVQIGEVTSSLPTAGKPAPAPKPKPAWQRLFETHRAQLRKEIVKGLKVAGSDMFQRERLANISENNITLTLNGISHKSKLTDIEAGAVAAIPEVQAFLDTVISIDKPAAKAKSSGKARSSGGKKGGTNSAPKEPAAPARKSRRTPQSVPRLGMEEPQVDTDGIAGDGVGTEADVDDNADEDYEPVDGGEDATEDEDDSGGSATGKRKRKKAPPLLKNVSDCYFVGISPDVTPNSDMEEMGISNVQRVCARCTSHVSGNCASTNWVTAPVTTGPFAT